MRGKYYKLFFEGGLTKEENCTFAALRSNLLKLAKYCHKIAIAVCLHVTLRFNTYNKDDNLS